VCDCARSSLVACVCVCVCGAQLQAAAAYPVRLTAVDSPAEKVVYAPQVHAPSVGHQDYFSGAHWLEHLPGLWETIWGSVASSRAPLPVVVSCTHAHLEYV
jgi:hypothetical protein